MDFNDEKHSPTETVPSSDWLLSLKRGKVKTTGKESLKFPESDFPTGPLVVTVTVNCHGGRNTDSTQYSTLPLLNQIQHLKHS